MIDIEREEDFLRQERSAIISYLQNFQISAKEMKEYKKLAKALADLVKIKTKILALEEEKNSLSFIRELMGVLKVDDKKYKDQWSKKHNDYMNQSKLYQQKKKQYTEL